MKFSTHLTHQLTPEWRSKYLRYESLKELIYRIVVADNRTQNSQSHSPQGEISVLPLVDIDGALEEEFFRELSTQLEEMELFYKSQEFKLKSRLNELGNQLNLLERQTLSAGRLSLRAVSKQKQELKFAYKEFYLNLIILQNFRVLNHTGFRKIAKKHDKVVVNTRGQEFMSSIVNESYMVKLSDVKDMIETAENEAIRLENGNRKKAMNQLRVPPLRHLGKGRGLFLTGFFLGCSAILLVAMLVAFIYFLPRHGFKHWKVAYSAFRPTLLLILFMFFYGFNSRAWVRYGVNHVLIFEFDPRNRMSVSQVFEVASLGLFIWSAAGLLYLFSPLLGIHQFVAPGLLLLVFIALFFLPFPLFFYRSRLWLMRKLLRVFLAPFFKVEFSDFWLGDQLNSLVVVLLDFEFYLCSCVVLLVAVDQGREIEGCGTHIYGLRPLLACIPAWLRFLQCLRRYRDSGRAFPHLVNAGKYSCALFVVFFSTINVTVKYSSGQAGAAYYLTLLLWIAAAVTNSCYTTAWDLIMDWGLFDGGCVLRAERVYPHASVYIIAAVQDAILRCSWTLTLSVGQANLFPQEILAFPVAILEVFRRFVWNFFRLENEHLNNCGEFRVVRDISLKPLQLEVEPNVRRRISLAFI